MLNENGRKVLERRYLIKNDQGETIEAPEDMFRRVAKVVAESDHLYDKKADVKKTEDEFYEMIYNLDFLPNSPTLMNAGRDLGQLSACFVLPIEDSMEGIFDAIKYSAIIHKSGGGTGFSFSRLRSAGSTVKTTGGVASGPISFMKVFNAATEAVKQGGTRRGANMGILRVDHPDILQFIECKKNNADITNFNISVGITEAFMEAVKADEKYDLVDPRTKEIRGQMKAKEVFNLIVDSAWNNGEPGIIFLDRMNRANVVPALGEIESTNPCGEQPLLPYESCNLGSINLVNFIRLVDGKKTIDYARLEDVVRKATHFLDNVIDANRFPLPEIEEMTKKTRKIGLGVMGFADLLVELGIPYNSADGIKTAEAVMRFIDEKSKEMSLELAAVRGVFPAFNESIYAELGLRYRNATTTTIAPTGTISIIAGVSSGVEPIFAISYVRNVMDNDELPEVNPIFERIAKERGFYTLELMRKIAKAGTVHGMMEVPEDIRRIFATAHDVDPESHIQIQAAFQRYTDNAVSKTINFCNDATKEDVRKAYILAYELGCKGTTIYRDGSRDSQVLNIGEVKRGEVSGCAECAGGLEHDGMIARERPEVTMGITEKVKIGCGNLYVTVNSDEDGICEVFTNVGRGGGCPSQSEATSRLISIALRAGVDVQEIVEQLRGIRCHSTLRQKGLKVLSCPDAIGRALERYLKTSGEFQYVKSIDELTNEIEASQGECTLNCHSCSTPCGPGKEKPAQKEVFHMEEESVGKMKFCPECGQTIQHEGGCVICRNCGYSKCN